MKAKLMIIKNNLLYVIAAGLIIVWAFGVVVYKAGVLIDVLLVLACFAIIGKLLVGRKTNHTSSIMEDSSSEDKEVGENPF